MSEREETKNQQQDPMAPTSEMLGIKVEPDAGSPSSGSREDWFSMVMKAGETGNDQHQNPNIPKVPDMLRKHEQDQECYNPLVVPIGPYHLGGGKREFREMKKWKAKLAGQFVSYTGKPIQVLYNKVAKEASYARNCYTKSSKKKVSDEEEFTRMMLLDGCFILRFIFCVLFDSEQLGMNDHIVASVKRDLLLLENQIPFRILKVLMGLTPKQHKKVWMSIIKCFIEDIPRRKRLGEIEILKDYLDLVGLVNKLENAGEAAEEGTEDSKVDTKEEKEPDSEVDTKEEKEPCHLLELFYDQFIGKNLQSQQNCVTDQAKEIARNRYLYYPSKELKKVGMKFKPSRTTAMTDIKYQSTLLGGILKLPPITIGDSTKSMLLNLVAYERYAGVKPWVTAYICFMDSLIDDAKDVEELRSSRIIYNFLPTDQHVADLFNHLASYLHPNRHIYMDVKRGINRQCKSDIKKWVAEFREVYFRSPWTFIAVFAATIAIILTAIQTYAAVFPL